MNLTVQRFMFFIFALLFSVLSLISAYYYFAQKNKTANVILTAITSDISETAYILSKNILSEESVTFMRPYLDRVTANNNFVLAIQIHDESKILLSTDPHFNKLIPTNNLYTSGESSSMLSSLT